MNVSWQCHFVRCLKKVSAHSKAIYQTNALNFLVLKRRHLFRIPGQRSNEDISVYVWVFLLLTRKLLGVVFVCHFKTTIQIFKVLCGFSFCILCLWLQMMLRYCPPACTPTHLHTGHASTHTHTHTGWPFPNVQRACTCQVITMCCLQRFVYM